MKTNYFLEDLVFKKIFYAFIIPLIIANSLLFLMEESPHFALSLPKDKILFFHQVSLYIFFCELILKLCIRGLKFFRVVWDRIDFVVIVSSFIGLFLGIPALGTLIVLRILKVAELIPRFKKIMEAFFQALPHVTGVAALIFLIYYIYGIFGTQLYSMLDPKHFGNFSTTLFTLLQLTFLDSWGDITGPIIEASPYSPLYFVSFTFLVSFSAINLIVGVFVEAVQQKSQEYHQEKSGKKNQLFQTLQSLKKHIIELEAHLERLEKEIESKEKIIEKG